MCTASFKLRRYKNNIIESLLFKFKMILRDDSFIYQFLIPLHMQDGLFDINIRDYFL